LRTNPYHLVSIAFDKNGEITNAGGLTKREYFAVMALQGLLASNTAPPSPMAAAYDAVNCADALIEALNLEKLLAKY
jgi:hypothetical protein